MSPEPGDVFGADRQLSQQEIAAAARALGDLNPIHHGANHGFAKIPGVIASGSHVAALFSALIPTHFSQFGDVLGLEMSFAFRAPIFPDTSYHMSWRVLEKAFNAKLQSEVYRLVGEVGGPAGQERAMTGEARIALFPRGGAIKG